MISKKEFPLFCVYHGIHPCCLAITFLLYRGHCKVPKMTTVGMQQQRLGTTAIEANEE